MYLTAKQQIKHLFKTDYKNIKQLSHTAKNLASQVIYNIRQHYFKQEKYLSYKDNYNLLKSSPSYKLLNSNISQQILKKVDGSFKSFFLTNCIKKLKLQFYLFLWISKSRKFVLYINQMLSSLKYSIFTMYRKTEKYRYKWSLAQLPPINVV